MILIVLLKGKKVDLMVKIDYNFISNAGIPSSC